MKKRVSKLEKTVGAPTYALLLDMGIEPGRARELIGPDGNLMPRKCTDEELEQIAGEGVEIAGRFIPWSKITRKQLDRMLDGAPPGVVLQELL